MFKAKPDDFNGVNRRRREGAAMKSTHRSVLTSALMTGVASLAFLTVGAAGVRAEIVTVQGDNGAAGEDGVNPGDPGLPGDDGESVAGNAGSTQPFTAPLNKSSVTGGNGGQGGNGAVIVFGFNSNGGNGGNAGAATATASTIIGAGSGKRTPIRRGDLADLEARALPWATVTMAAMAAMLAVLPPRHRRQSGRVRGSKRQFVGWIWRWRRFYLWLWWKWRRCHRHGIDDNRFGLRGSGRKGVGWKRRRSGRQ